MLQKRQFGIKLKITLGFSLVFILLSLAFNLYSYQQIRRLLIEDNDRYMLASATNLLNKTEISPTIIPLPDKNTSIRVLYRSNGKPIIVFESPGIIKKIKTPITTGVSDTLGMRVTYLVSYSQENPAELVMVTSGEQLENNLRFLLFVLFACSFFSVLVASAVAYILAVYLLKPVQRIIDAAKRISASKLHDTINVNNTNDELQELTETINEMLLRIDEAVKQQENFFASASHELKTPLAILKAELEVTLKKADLDKDFVNLLTSQLAEINRLQQVVQEFLLVSQLKSGGLKLFKEPVDIASVLLKIFNRLQPLFQQKNFTTTIDFDKEIDNFIVDVDQDKLQIVLMNIVENAIKYGVAGTLLSCKVEKTTNNQFLQIRFSNTIAEKKILTEKLQDAFYRADLQQNGVGLGLWLCNEIIELHAGKLVLESSNYVFKTTLLLPVK